MARNRNWWWIAANLLIGAPGGFVFLFTAIGLQGFMGPPTRRGQIAAVFMALCYALIWFLANLFLLRDITDRKRQLLRFGASLLITAASAFVVTFAVLQLRLLS